MTNQCKEYKVLASSPPLETTVEGHPSFKGPHGVVEAFTEFVSQSTISFTWSYFILSTGVYILKAFLHKVFGYSQNLLPKESKLWATILINSDIIRVFLL